MCITRVKWNTSINNFKNVNLPFLQSTIPADSDWWGGIGIQTGYIRCPPGLCPGTDSLPNLYKWPARGGLLPGTIVCWWYSPVSHIGKWGWQFNTPKRSQHSIGVGDQVGYGIQPMESVTSARYLGVDISGSLSWNPHVDRITGNANRTLGFVRRNIKTKMSKVRETAYNT